MSWTSRPPPGQHYRVQPTPPPPGSVQEAEEMYGDNPHWKWNPVTWSWEPKQLQQQQQQQQHQAPPPPHQAPLSYRAALQRGTPVATATHSAIRYPPSAGVKRDGSVLSYRPAFATAAPPPSKRARVASLDDRTSNSLGAPARPASGKQAWPDSLRGYANRVLNLSKDEKEANAIQAWLQEEIASAMKANLLWTIDWSRAPMPPRRLYPSVADPGLHGNGHWGRQGDGLGGRGGGGFGHGGTSTGDTADQPGEDLANMTKKQRKKAVKKAREAAAAEAAALRREAAPGKGRGIAPLKVTQQERSVRNQRAERFAGQLGVAPSLREAKGKKKKNGPSSILTASLNTGNFYGEEYEWGGLGIIGTCEKLEKPYLRLTSAPRPEDVRPERVLRRALRMVQQRLKNDPDVAYLWVWEQLKSIRQDMTVQRILNDLTVETYETHARVALQEADLSEFSQCQGRLKELYSNAECARASRSIGEFIGYRILYYLNSGNQMDMLKQLQALGPRDRTHANVKHALAVRDAIISGNYVAFFKLYHATPSLGKALIDLFLPRQRLAALASIAAAYRPTVPLAWLSKQLAFDSVRELHAWAVSYDIQGIKLADAVLDCKVCALSRPHWRIESQPEEL